MLDLCQISYYLLPDFSRVVRVLVDTKFGVYPNVA